MRVRQEEGRIVASDEWLEISVTADPEGQSSAEVQLNWRPTAEAVQRLAEAEATDARLLVVIEHHGEEIQRQIFPFVWGKSYVGFSHIGANTIHATIVWSDDPGDRSAERLFIKRLGHKSYLNEVLGRERPTVAAIDKRRDEVVERLTQFNNSEDKQAELEQELEELNTRRNHHYHDPFEVVIQPDLFRSLRDHDTAYQLGRVKLTVEVPKEMFGNKDSWPITRLIGGVFFDDANPPRDNCHLRKRASITALTSPVWIVLGLFLGTVGYTVKYIIGAVVIGLLHFWGARNISYQTFSLSWDYWPNSAWRRLEPSRWWTKKVWGTDDYGVVDQQYSLRHPIFLVVNPPVMLLVISFLLWIDTTGTSSLWWVAVSALVITALVVGLVISATYGRYNQPELDPEQEQQQKEALRQQLQQRYGAVETGQSRAPVLRLWFREIKAEVCRPFARNS